MASPLPTLQAMGDAQQAEYMRGRRILEINPNHPIIQSLKEKVVLGALIWDESCDAGRGSLCGCADVPAAVQVIACNTGLSWTWRA